MIKSEYFYDKLNTPTVNDAFNGFFPRWIIPGTKMKGDKHSTRNSTQTMIAIDSEKEIYIGVGHDFPPHILGSGEMMIPLEIANYLHKKVGDSALLSLDITSFLGKDAYMQIFAMLLEHDEEVTFDFVSRTIKHKDDDEAFQFFIPEAAEPWLDMKIIDTFDQSYAKYSQIWGNVAILDCHYVMDELFASVLIEIAPLKVLKPDIWKKIHDEIVMFQNYFAYYDINFCTWAFQLDGVLKDQAKYYMGSSD